VPDLAHSVFTGLSPQASDLADALSYAIKLAWTSETYLVHSWMVLLGLLRNEKSIACQVRWGEGGQKCLGMA
jgi:hypothetical protein